MFPQFRERMGSALDIVVEFSTLGEYRLAANGALCSASALAPTSRKRPARPGAKRLAPEREPQMGGAGALRPEAAGSAGCAGYEIAARAAVRRIVAGGAADLVSAATPAARRLSEGPRRSADQAPTCRGERRRGPRSGNPVSLEQLCLAV